MTAPADPGTDGELAQRAANGEREAFDAIVARYKERVFRLAHRFFRQPADAEDVAQEVFVKLYRSIGSYRSDAPFEHWVMRSAGNVCRDHLRARRRRPATPLAELTGEPAAWLDRALAGESLDAAASAVARVVAADLLDRLAPTDRLILVWLDLEGRSTAEIAALLGTTRAAVKLRAFRARRALRRLAASQPRSS